MGRRTGATYQQQQVAFQHSIREVSERIRKTLGQVPAQLQEEFLVAAAFDVAGRAMRRAPVETGHLRESGWVEVNGVELARGTEAGELAQNGAKPPVHGSQATAVVGFNATTPDGKYSYALIQHEETEFSHPLGGEAKYLERSVNEVANDFQANLATAVERALKRRGGA